MFRIDRREPIDRQMQSRRGAIRIDWIEAASDEYVGGLLMLLLFLRNGLSGEKAIRISKALNSPPNDVRAREQLFSPTSVDFGRLIWCQQSGLSQGIDPHGIK